MRNSGLNESLAFFDKERKQMIAKSEELSIESGTSFSHVILDDPEYINTTLTPIHALERAMHNNNVPEFLSLCEKQEMRQDFEKKPRLMRQSVLYLINIAQNEDSPYASEALRQYRNIKEEFKDTTSLAITEIFLNAKRITMDSDLLKKFKASDILAIPGKDKAFENDKFGNDILDYALDAYYEASSKTNKLIHSLTMKEWINSFRLLCKDDSIDIERKYGRRNQALIDILPPSTKVTVPTTKQLDPKESQHDYSQI